MLKTYTTQQGDTWDYISYKLFGTELGMNALVEANQDYRETVIFGSATVLTVPDYEAPSANTLPPWRQ